MNEVIIYSLIGGAIGLVIAFFKFKTRGSISPYREPDREFPREWRSILETKIEFYKKLERGERKLFEYKVHVFLLNVRIIGLQTEVTHEDRILIGASAVIPIFRFKNWHYRELYEIQLYPDKFRIPTTDKLANGLVGWGAMEGKMLLSKKALRHGFEDNTDGKNVAIHEFIHLFDKADGDIDGLLETIIRENDIEPWLYLVHSKMEEIRSGKSTLRPYGGTNQAEFLAVVGEYFFEKPEQMKSEQPDLYAALNSFFNPPQALLNKFKHVGSYDDCPCGSRKRFGKCCSKNSQVY